MITAGNIYDEICKVTTERERGHWCSDFYCKITPATEKIIHNYEFSHLVEIFEDNITHTLWYDIPFVYPLDREKELL